MLEDAILAAKAGGAGLEKPRDSYSPQITVDAPIMIPDDYVPDLDLRMGLYRRLNEVEDRPGLESFAAELIDRFGKLPAPTQNLLKLIEIKQNCIAANISKIDLGQKGALVSFHEDRFPNPAGLIAYVQRLEGTARLRPDSKMVITRAWADPVARLNGALQLSKGLAKIAG
jgi:transcription-repair coupling factor (superfamily II helicase)